MTGVDLQGTTVGFAGVGELSCSSNGHGLSEYFGNDSIQAELVAHELGHNWNACHCDASCNPNYSGSGRCGIMTSYISTFSGDTHFNNFSDGQIITRRDAIASCRLDSCGGCCGNPKYVNSGSAMINQVANSVCGSTIYPQPRVYSAVTSLTRSTSGPVTIDAALGPVTLDPN